MEWSLLRTTLILSTPVHGQEDCVSMCEHREIVVCRSIGVCLIVIESDEVLHMQTHNHIYHNLSHTYTHTLPNLEVQIPGATSS